MSAEEWRAIHGGDYEVSSRSRVRRVTGGRGATPGRILRAGIDGRGYFTVRLYARSETVHRLVAFAFLGRPPARHEVNHKDGNKLNNLPSNLEWCSRAENIRHAFATGLSRARSGTEHYRSKLTLADIENLRAAAAGHTRSDLARRFCVSLPTVDRVLRGQVFANLSLPKVSPRWEPRHGTRSAHLKLTREQVDVVLATPGVTDALATKFGVSASTIVRARRNHAVWNGDSQRHIMAE